MNLQWNTLLIKYYLSSPVFIIKKQNRSCKSSDIWLFILTFDKSTRTGVSYSIYVELLDWAELHLLMRHLFSFDLVNFSNFSCLYPFLTRDAERYMYLCHQN
jgi:hypothetical protein